jgi:hypothetical protein
MPDAQGVGERSLLGVPATPYAKKTMKFAIRNAAILRSIKRLL